MMRKRRDEPAASEASPDEPAGEDTEPGPGNFKDQAGQCREAAQEARSRAAGCRARAEVVNAEAAREIARISAVAQQTTAGLEAEAADAERAAAADDERAGYLERADVLEDQADDASERAAALADEREHLTVFIAGLDADMTGLDGKRQKYTAQLEAARQANDLKAVTSALAQLVGIDDLTATHRGKQDAAKARLLEIGDQGGGELGDALATASRHHAELRRILNILDPGRPEAVYDAALAEVRAVLEANRTRLSEEREQQDRRRTVLL